MPQTAPGGRRWECLFGAGWCAAGISEALAVSRSKLGHAGGKACFAVVVNPTQGFLTRQGKTGWDEGLDLGIDAGGFFFGGLQGTDHGSKGEAIGDVLLGNIEAALFKDLQARPQGGRIGVVIEEPLAMGLAQAIEAVGHFFDDVDSALWKDLCDLIYMFCYKVVVNIVENR